MPSRSYEYPQFIDILQPELPNSKVSAENDCFPSDELLQGCSRLSLAGFRWIIERGNRF